jgi:sucrose-6-phosphatase
MNPFLFVTDLDNTLVGDRPSLTELNQRLEEHRQTHGTKLVYATGRSLDLYQELATQEQLLVPDALIAAVGTEIYFNGETAPNLDWANSLQSGWHRETIFNLGGELADLVLQPLSEQREFKISYFLAEAAATEILPRLESMLETEGIKAKLIYSSGKDLDIIPRQSDKGLAVKFVQKAWQIAPTQTVVCGDSGNDIPLFSVGQERGIIVGNAQPELRLWAQVNPVSSRYQAKTDCAAGILEGLMYFGFL